jgi:hypothetical protein
MARDCIIQKRRKLIYGFYVCERLIIEDGRTSPLNIIGTFIVNSIHGGVFNPSTQKVDSPTPKPNLNKPVIWRTVWDPVSANLFINHYNNKYRLGQLAPINDCLPVNNLKYLGMIQNNQKGLIETCSAVNFVEDGLNNLRWTTVDPDIGLPTPTSVMTSQKVSRIHRWIIREDSRFDLVR